MNINIEANKSAPIENLLNLTEKFLPLLTVLFFLIGIGMATAYEPFAYSVSGLVEGFIDSYGYIAPVVIF